MSGERVSVNRLTGWDNGNAFQLSCFEGKAGCEDMGTSKCDFCEHHLSVYSKLARYEDTDLAPEDISRLTDENARLTAELEQVRRERDAAIEAFTSCAHYGGSITSLCEFCNADCIGAGLDCDTDVYQCGCFQYGAKEGAE